MAFVRAARRVSGGSIVMAAEGDANNDFKAHEGTYAAFTGLMKWGTIVAAIIAVIVILVIRN
jgi:hypothetical protein